MNWFNRTKLADSSGGGGGGDVEENGFHAYEGGRNFGQDEQISWYGRQEYKETDLEGYNDGTVKLKREKTKPVKDPEPAVVKDKANDVTSTGDSIKLPLRDGERVRDRRRGNALEQRFGRVVDISDNAFFIQWEDKDKPEKFKLNDTIGIAKVLARV